MATAHHPADARGPAHDRGPFPCLAHALRALLFLHPAHDRDRAHGRDHAPSPDPAAEDPPELLGDGALGGVPRKNPTHSPPEPTKLPSPVPDRQLANFHPSPSSCGVSASHSPIHCHPKSPDQTNHLSVHRTHHHHSRLNQNHRHHQHRQHLPGQPPAQEPTSNPPPLHAAKQASPLPVTPLQPQQPHQQARPLPPPQANQPVPPQFSLGAYSKSAAHEASRKQKNHPLARQEFQENLRFRHSSWGRQGKPPTPSRRA